MKDQKRKSGKKEAIKHKSDSTSWEDEAMNKSLQGVDKAPGEESGKGEKVTLNDLKGKQVDEDPSTETGKPLSH